LFKEAAHYVNDVYAFYIVEVVRLIEDTYYGVNPVVALCAMGHVTSIGPALRGVSGVVVWVLFICVTRERGPGAVEGDSPRNTVGGLTEGELRLAVFACDSGWVGVKAADKVGVKGRVSREVATAHCTVTFNGTRPRAVTVMTV